MNYICSKICLSCLLGAPNCLGRWTEIPVFRVTTQRIANTAQVSQVQILKNLRLDKFIISLRSLGGVMKH